MDIKHESAEKTGSGIEEHHANSSQAGDIKNISLAS
jgi:hypothetical protein